MLLGQIDALDTQINTLSRRIEELIAELPDDALGFEHTDADPGPGSGPGAGVDTGCRDVDPHA